MEEEIELCGGLVRQLKADKAEKAVIKAAVDELLALKKKLADAGGAPAAPVKEDKKKEEKEAGGKNAKQAAKDARLAARQA